MNNREFGRTVYIARKKRNWTVKDFIEKLGDDGKKVSPTYITKIEVYGEIPSPELICKIAEVLGYDQQELLNIAKNSKVDIFSKNLEEKYQKAIGMYRLEKEKKNVHKRTS